MEESYGRNLISDGVINEEGEPKEAKLRMEAALLNMMMEEGVNKPTEPKELR